MAKPDKVRNIIELNGYKQGIKKLIKDNKWEEVDEIRNIVNKLITFSITKEYHNHPLHGKLEGYWDLHVRKNIILIYRYTGKGLEIDLELNNLIDHDYGFSNARK